MKAILPALLLGTMTNVLFASPLTGVKLYQAVENGVYTISATDGSEQSVGSAVAVTDSVLATSCHIGGAAKGFKVKIAGKYYKSKLIYANTKHDLCLLTVDQQRFKPVNMLPSTEVNIGEDVYAIGNPYGIEKSIARGIISNKRHVDGAWVLQSDVTLEAGSSGGGLFNTEGKLIGIIYAGHRLKNIGFIMPTEWIQAGLAQ